MSTQVERGANANLPAQKKMPVLYPLDRRLPQTDPIDITRHLNPSNLQMARMWKFHLTFLLLIRLASCSLVSHTSGVANATAAIAPDVGISYTEGYELSDEEFMLLERKRDGTPTNSTEHVLSKRGVWAAAACNSSRYSFLEFN